MYQTILNRMIRTVLFFVILLPAGRASCQHIIHRYYDEKEGPKNWSQWIPVLDRNENKVQVSITFASLSPIGYVDDKKKIPTFFYKIRNKYSEPVSGRILFRCRNTDGDEIETNCIIYKLEPNQEYLNELQSLRNVVSAGDFRFVEFASGNKNSPLLSYTASDSTIFKIYMAAKQSSIATMAASANASGTDNTVKYTGKNEVVIRSVLSKVKGWKTNSGMDVKDGVPPQVPITYACQRDQYAYSALLYAWAAESYYRLGKATEAGSAADKVGEMYNIILELCKGSIAFDAGKCQTMDLIPCSSGVTTAAVTGSLSSPPSSVERKEDFSKEKELFSGLIPVLSSLSTDNYAQQATSISGFMDKLSSYSDNNAAVGPIVNICMKLAALSAKVQAEEIAGTNNGFLSALSAGGGSSTPGARPAFSLGYGQQSIYQQDLAVRNSINAFAEQMNSWINPDGPTNSQLRRKTKLGEVIYNRSTDYRAKYGYTVQEFTDAIKNFEYQKLDKILATGFPADTKVIHDNPSTEVQSGDYYGSDYYLNGLHYACIYGNEYAIKKFLEKGLDINGEARGFKGFNWYTQALTWCRPIDIAILFHQRKIVELLLAGHAETSHRGMAYYGNYGSAYSLAKQLGFFDLAKMLESYPR